MKKEAHYIVSKAIEKGEMVPKPCEKCGNPKSVAHHEDYSKPLEVTWLCHACHMQHHWDRWSIPSEPLRSPRKADHLIFLAGGRRRRLFRRKRGGTFHLRFQCNGKDVVRSLGTTTESVAKEKAKQVIEAQMNGDLVKSRSLKMRSDYSTLREVTDIYVVKFGIDARRRRTAKNNVGALEKIVRVAAGSDLDKARTSILTGELVRKFESVEEQRIEKDRNGFVIQESELRVRTSIGSWLKQARSVFKRSHMAWFEDLALPDLESFRTQGVTNPERPRPRPLDDHVMLKINAAAPALARDNPRCYIAHLLFKFLGMRNSEQKMARKSWIVRSPTGGAKLGVIYRPEEGFKPKKKTERWIPLAPTVLAELEKYWTTSPDGDYLVPADHKTERGDIIDDQHSAWCGQWIKDRSKVSYELRRHAGSLVYRKTGKIEHVQQFLGHADLKTTMEWYWYLLDETPALDMSDFALPVAMAAVA